LLLLKEKETKGRRASERSQARGFDATTCVLNVLWIAGVKPPVRSAWTEGPVSDTSGRRC